MLSSRENSADCLARSGEAWESLGNCESRFARIDLLDHAKVIYDQPRIGDGADNDLKYATYLVADVATCRFAFVRCERGGPAGAAFVWGYALLGACSCARRHGPTPVPLLLRLS